MGLSYAFIKDNFIPLAEANVSVMTNFIHYGTGVFEGIRGNWNEEKKQNYIFALEDHYERMLDGCRVLKIDLPYSIEELCNITVELVDRCGFEEDIYIRPVAYKSSEALGVRLHNLENDFMVFAFPWGPYLPDKVKCCVSSWRFPSEVPRAKLTGLYVTNALAKTEAVDHGYDEAIMLTPEGYVAEGSGENIFLYKNGELVTPAVYDGVLIGITRKLIIELAEKKLGLKTVERHVNRLELYNAEECFLTGTAANITPVAEIDGRKVANGEIGKVTLELQKIYNDIIKGNNPEYDYLCTPAHNSETVNR
ncbi:MAG: branched-chain amino acid transaminase [Dehalococcoidales bacterium]|nr:branched-chain amino acid transaminase [Dehalococcoidales bacterium]